MPLTDTAIRKATAKAKATDKMQRTFDAAACIWESTN